MEYADSKISDKGIKLQIHICNTLHNREWLQMEDTLEKIWKVARSLCEI